MNITKADLLELLAVAHITCDDVVERLLYSYQIEVKELTKYSNKLKDELKEVTDEEQKQELTFSIEQADRKANKLGGIASCIYELIDIKYEQEA